MMVFDSLLYCALGLYCDKVLRGENGTRNLWNYLFQKGSLKTKITKVNQSPKPEVNIRDNLLKDQLIPYCVHTSETSVESISLEMKQQELDGRCIQIRNLHKEYTSRKGNCCAVNSLKLTFYENQILALLGEIPWLHLISNLRLFSVVFPALGVHDIRLCFSALFIQLLLCLHSLECCTRIM